MTRKFESKLNNFVISIPSGLVLTTEWLDQRGISPKLAWWYVHAGLLERVGAKAYKKAKDTISWAGAVATLQNLMGLPFHVGGKTALQLLGYSHFLPMQGIKQVMLFANPQTKLPRWFKNNEWNVEFEIFKTTLFRDDNLSLGIIERPIEGMNLLLSCPERAAMEMLWLVVEQESFDEAMLLIENFGQLRPKVVQSLLEKCNSIKVKRLFLYLSEKSQHAWLANLDLKNINLGRGKRVIGRGGKYDAKYALSVPKITEE